MADPIPLSAPDGTGSPALVVEPPVVRWALSWRADPHARDIADRHYNRQTVGAPQFVPPGRCLVLTTPHALWITSWPLAQYVKHAWAGAWLCSAFRNERPDLARSSELIVEVVAATRARFGNPPAIGMVTFVDPKKVRHKRDPGRCFLRAGFRREGATKGGLLAFVLAPDAMPPPAFARGAQPGLCGVDVETVRGWSG